jgi:hypothetical protein
MIWTKHKYNTTTKTRCYTLRDYPFFDSEITFDGDVYLYHGRRCANLESAQDLVECAIFELCDYILNNVNHAGEIVYKPDAHNLWVANGAIQTNTNVIDISIWPSKANPNISIVRFLGRWNPQRENLLFSRYNTKIYEYFTADAKKQCEQRALSLIKRHCRRFIKEFGMDLIKEREFNNSKKLVEFIENQVNVLTKS